MKRRLAFRFQPALLAALLAAPLAPVGPAAASFVSEHAFEFTAAADLDANGVMDVVIVDRVSGQYRIGYRSGSGNLTWAPARPAGIPHVTGLAVGRFLGDNLDALAVTSPQANRVSVLAAPNASSPALPVALFIPSTGPECLAGLDAGGAGNTIRDDFLVGSRLNGSSPFALDLMRNANGTALAPLDSTPLSASPARANPVRLKSSGPILAGLLLRSHANAAFKVYSLGAGTLVEAASTAPDLPSGADYVYGFFGSGGALARFLFYQPGSNGLHLRVVQEPAPAVFAFAPGPIFNLGVSIDQVFAVPSGAVDRLLVLSNQGQTARIYEFDGENFPVPGPAFAPPPDAAFTTASVLPNGDLLLLTGAAGQGVSTGFQTYQANGASYFPGPSGALPQLSPVGRTANVLQFNAEPFTDSNARILGALNAGDWSSLYQLSGGQATAQAETFLGPDSGLGNPAIANLGAPPAGTAYGLVNQFANHVSLFSLASPVGESVADVEAQPPAGAYATSVQISLLSLTPNAVIRYRLSPAADWQLYAAPFWIFQSTTVEFFAQPASGSSSAKSPVHHAAYLIQTPPGTLDSDGDGVPDHVELAYGLDPVLSGNDGDGDGYYDLDELVHGFDPNNPLNHPPTGHARLELHAAVDLILTPRPWDGTLNGPSVAANGTRVRACDLNGGLLIANSVITDPVQTGVATPAVLLSNIVVDTGGRLLAIATDPHFDIATPGPDKRLGRELLRLVDATELDQPVSLPVTWSGGSLGAEAAAWTAAATAVLQGTVRPKVTGELTVFDTLATVLVETKLRDLLVARGLTSFDRVTLFPFRPPDIDRSNPSAAQLLALESMQDDIHPGYSLPAMLRTVEDLVSLPDNFGFANLRSLTRDIYRLSSASNNVPPGLLDPWPVFPSPVNVLRDFVDTGVLHSNYAAHTALPPPGIDAAYIEARFILDSIQPRPLTTLTLAVRSDTFSGPCALLDTPPPGPPKTWSLLRADGSPFNLLQAFVLPPRSEIQVTGYTDVTNNQCFAFGIEILSLSLLSVPAPAPGDSDGDLLLDSLELLLFGDLSQGGLEDTDGDQFSNLEEQFAGTDPGNASSKPPGAPANLGPPEILIQLLPGGGSLSMSWSWSSVYASKIQFQVLSAPVLGNPFQNGGAAVTESAPGQYQVTLPNPAAPGMPLEQYFQVQMTLK